MDSVQTQSNLVESLPTFPTQNIDCRSVVPESLVVHSSSEYVKILCPFHEDTSPSCVVYSERYYCYACNAGGKAVSLYMALHNTDRDSAIHAIDSGVYPQTQPQTARQYSLPKQTLALELHRNLTDAAMEYYLDERGLLPETISQYQLGWGSLYPSGAEGYTIPVYSRQKLRQIKLRLPHETKDKYRSVGGAGSWLYLGEDIQYAEQVFLCGGEFDALVLRQNGYLATAPTSGEKRFDASWVGNFDGTTPYCCYDNDAAGEAGYEKLRKIFQGRIKRVRLPVKDVTEYFLRYDEFSQHIADADVAYSLH